MTVTIAAGGVVKRFGETRALDGLDLQTHAGQVVAVLGPNGAGKTTLVGAIATLHGIDGGSLRVNGHDVQRSPHAVRRTIGLAGQFAAIEPAMTGRENLEMVGRLFGQDRATVKAAAAEVLERFDLGKLDLGASLVGAPRLLLLDEPTTGLDPRSRIELWDAIRSLVGQGTDVLLTTQYLDEAEHLAGHVVIIDHGRVVAAGAPADLKQRLGGSVIEVHVRYGDDLSAAAGALDPIRPWTRTRGRGDAPGERPGRGRRGSPDAGDAFALRGADRDRRHLAAAADARRGVPHPDRNETGPCIGAGARRRLRRKETTR